MSVGELVAEADIVILTFACSFPPYSGDPGFVEADVLQDVHLFQFIA